MPFGIPSEDFHGGFGIPEQEERVDNRSREIYALSQILSRVDLSMSPIFIAKYLYDRGVRVIRDN